MSKKTRLVNTVITNLIRIILFLTFIYATTSSRMLIQAVSIIAILVTFIPATLEKVFKIKIPAILEVIYLMFIYGLLTLGELRGLYHDSIWWNILMTFTASIALGFAGLTIIHVLHKTNRINTNPILAGVLVFSFALSLSTLWEIFEFVLDLLIHSGLQRSLIDTMQDLSLSVLGALLVSIAGYNHIRTGSSLMTSHFLTEMLEKNTILLGPKRKQEDTREKVRKIIQLGETAKIEFKSTLRTNLHTGQPDKRMELGVLKTITAFLNTKGGHLLIGIDDNKKILGLDADNFQSDDKANLHLTNLIKFNIGNEFLPFIKFAIVEIENKKVILITCKESKKRVFLKFENKEEFYVRNGPASVKLEGGTLVDYIKYRF